MIYAIILAAILIIAAFAFTQRRKFGRLPRGERLKAIEQSPNFKNGSFHNLIPTTVMTKGVSYSSVLREYLFSKNKKPPGPIPTVKTDLKSLRDDTLIWFGHSSYFMRVGGKNILVDPVLSRSASPVSFTTRAFEGSNIYSSEDIPDIDYLFITHDHWDHLDYRTILKLRPRVRRVLCGLGVGEHLEYWNFDKGSIIERDWNEQINLDDGFTAYTAPARHFSGRGFKRNASLWTSFVLRTPRLKIFIGGDSGYGPHFAEMGKTFGEFDLAILDNGQYDRSWKGIHMHPENVLRAALDLRARRLLPVHYGRFSISNHAWDEPLNRISALAEGNSIKPATPMIGEPVDLCDESQVFSHWWREV